jgi:hypothetical protein
MATGRSPSDTKLMIALRQLRGSIVVSRRLRPIAREAG